MPTVLDTRYQIYISLTTHQDYTGRVTPPPSPLTTCNLFEQRDSLQHPIFTSTSPIPSTSAATEKEESTARFIDPRLGPVRIDLIEHPLMAVRTGSSHHDSSAGTSAQRAVSTAASSASQSSTHVRVNSGPSNSSSNATWKARFDKAGSFPVEAEGGVEASEVMFGVVHLFKEAQGGSQHQSKPQTDSQAAQTAYEDETGTLLAVLGLPSTMTAAEFLAWVEPARESVQRMRMIREGNAGRCTVLMQFREAVDAEEFYKQYFDQPLPHFASSQHSPTRDAAPPSGSSTTTAAPAQIVYVTQVTLSSSSQLPYAYPQLANSDPWPLASLAVPGPSTTKSDGDAALAPATDPAARLALSLATELPTCPVCLERMDSSVTGLMTVSCQHTFHCDCLSRWGDARCPVCRYSQNRTTTPGMTSLLASRGRLQGDATGDEDRATQCTVCNTTDDLWVCLICATVGCGRYKKGCAKRHFVESGHIYSLELETSRVWDYVNDGYIHRLIQNRADGKLVELPSTQSTPQRRRIASGGRRRSRPRTSDQAGSSQVAEGQQLAQSSGRGQDDDDYADSDDDYEDEDEKDTKSGGKLGSTNDKLEAISLEYQYLLLSQLESQRAYYEEQVRRLQSEVDQGEGNGSGAGSSSAAWKAREEEWSQEKTRWEQDRQEAAEREKRLTARCEKALEMGQRLSKDLQAERSLSQGLVARCKKNEEQAEADKKEKARLKRELEEQTEQVNDLMFALSAPDKIKEAGGEEGGDLVIKPGKGKPITMRGGGGGGGGGSSTATVPTPLAQESQNSALEGTSEGSGGAAKKKNKKKKKAKGKAQEGVAVPEEQVDDDEAAEGEQSKVEELKEGLTAFPNTIVQ